MTEEQYKSEVAMLRQAIKTLLFIVTEYMSRSNITDQWGRKVDFSAEMNAVRETLRLTESFNKSWKDE